MPAHPLARTPRLARARRHVGRSVTRATACHAIAAGENEKNTEELYADLFQRFDAVRKEFNRADVERAAMRKALLAARKNVQDLSEKNKRLDDLVTEVKREQHRMAAAKETVMKALGMEAE